MACVLVNTACKNAFSCFFLLFWVVDVYIAFLISFFAPQASACHIWHFRDTESFWSHCHWLPPGMYYLLAPFVWIKLKTRLGLEQVVFMVITLLKLCLTFLKLVVYHKVTNIFSLDSRFNLKLTWSMTLGTKKSSASLLHALEITCKTSMAQSQR